MRRLGMCPVRWVLALAGLCGLMAWVSTAATAAPTPAPTPGHYTGTLTDGGTWIADVPASWNGTLLLYSHGYGPLIAADTQRPDDPGRPAGHGLRDGGFLV